MNEQVNECIEYVLTTEYGIGPLPSVWVDDSVNQKTKKPTCTCVLGSVNIEYRQKTELL